MIKITRIVTRTFVQFESDEPQEDVELEIVQLLLDSGVPWSAVNQYEYDPPCYKLWIDGKVVLKKDT